MEICKNCGASLVGIKPIDGVIKCKSCRSLFTVAKIGLNADAAYFLKMGEHDLDTCKFDDAYKAFYSAAQKDGTEPEAYWGMALAEFKVQYIKDIDKDTQKQRLQPVCHGVTDSSFRQNKNYLAALQCATSDQKIIYRERAEEIDYIRQEFLNLKRSGIDYDCFICVKVSRIDSEQSGVSEKNWTKDAYIADEIYDLLKRNGYTPFFSEREIRGRTGADYEAMVLYALYTSETMLVVCSNQDYLKTPWVNNEFMRFKELIGDSEKENDSLTIVYSGKPINKLPGASRGAIQGIDYGRKDSAVEILKFVELHTPQSRAKREEAKKQREKEAELNKKAIAELQAQIEALQQKTVANTNVGASSTILTLFERANQEAKAGRFDKAVQLCNGILEIEPYNGQVWWQKFLFEMNTLDYRVILDKLSKSSTRAYYQSVLENKSLEMAVKYAQGDLQGTVYAFHEQVLKLVEFRRSSIRDKISNSEWQYNYSTNLVNEQIVKMAMLDNKLRFNHKNYSSFGRFMKRPFLLALIPSCITGIIAWFIAVFAIPDAYLPVWLVNGKAALNGAGIYLEAVGFGLLTGVAIAAVFSILLKLPKFIVVRINNRRYEKMEKERDNTEQLIAKHRGVAADEKRKIDGYSLTVVMCEKYLKKYNRL